MNLKPHCAHMKGF